MRRIMLSLSLFASALLTGCFTCEAPFYEANQVVQDERLTGTYDNSQDGKKDGSIWTFQPSMDFKGKYDVFIKDGTSQSSSWLHCSASTSSCFSICIRFAILESVTCLAVLQR